MVYARLADLIVAIHVLYVTFVVAGLLLILLGAVARWSWIRNFWFRLAHLIAIVLVAIEAFLGINCPLTVWEDQFRRAAGQEVMEGSFLGRCLHRLIFFDLPHWAFDALHIGFAIVVIATFVLVPPRWIFGEQIHHRGTEPQR
jgi:hypothetical protein